MNKDGIKKVPYLNISWCTGVTKGGSGGKMVGEEEDEKSILRIRSQVEKTRTDWLRDEDSSCNSEHLARRAEIFERFRDEIHLWNRDRIEESCVSVGNGPAGLGLRDEVDPIHDAFSYYLYNEMERSVHHGISSHPKSMSPWKIAKSNFTVEDFKPLWKKFSRLASVKVFGKRFLTQQGLDLWEEHAQRYLEQGFNTVRSDFMETRFNVGAFPRSSPGLGNYRDFLMIRSEETGRLRPAWTGEEVR